MQLKETLKSIINGFWLTPVPIGIKRNIELPLNLKKIISVIGARRAGKTYILYDTVNRLTASGVPLKNILFINFEDERLQLKTADLDLILQVWRELHNGEKLINHWFFFDEIQNVTGWEKFVRRIYDTVTKNIFITGSNSAFLAKEIATSLRGRTLPVEVFPFSFDEYLKYFKTGLNYYDELNKAAIINRFNDYLSNGGFPEALPLSETVHSELLRNYYYVMLYKDLIERYRISSPAVLKFFIGKLADNLSKPFSVNKIYNDLRSMGLKLDKNFLYELIVYLENIYLTFNVTRHDFSFISRSRSDKKVYFIDNGLINILTHAFSGNKGKLLENSVYLFLRSRFGVLYENNIFYFKKEAECDFALFDRGKPVFCIQSSYDISNPDTKKREITGLLAAMKFFGLKKGFIITAEQSEELTLDDKKIIILPAYKVFIDKNIDDI